MRIDTPYGPVIDLGTETEHNYGGPALAIGWVHGVRAAEHALLTMSADSTEHSDCVQVVRDLLR